MIRDQRIGTRIVGQGIRQHPSRYADGTPYNRNANPAPIRRWLTKEYFVVLPHLSSGLSPELEAELLKVIADAQAEQAPSTQPRRTTTPPQKESSEGAGES